MLCMVERSRKEVENEYDESQLMKGVLEGCVLLIIEKEETYGYEIIRKLKNYGFYNLSEGTIYPLLLRFEKRGLIKAVFKASPMGPKRKYFTISDKGEKYLIQFIAKWSELSKKVNIMIKEEKDEIIRVKENE